MKKLDWFDRVESGLAWLGAVLWMFGCPLAVGILAVKYLASEEPPLIQVATGIGCAILALFAFPVVEGLIFDPITDVFNWVRRRRGRPPLRELEQEIAWERQEAAEAQEERAKQHWTTQQVTDQLYSLFNLNRQLLDRLKAIHSLLRFIMFLLLALCCLLLVPRVLQWFR